MLRRNQAMAHPYLINLILFIYLLKIASRVSLRAATYPRLFIILRILIL